MRNRLPPTKRLHCEPCEPRTMLHCHIPFDAEEFCPGDANRDGVFNTQDVLLVLQAGEYEDDHLANSTWAEGDWNGDGDFDRQDIILALQSGSYTPTEALFPDVLDATLTLLAGNTFRVSVTLSSPYDTPARYADAWRVLDEQGNVLGLRILTHDHQNEQPFTRSLSGVEVPLGVQQVTIQGRDQVSGWGGQTVTVAVPR